MIFCGVFLGDAGGIFLNVYGIGFLCPQQHAADKQNAAAAAQVQQAGGRGDLIFHQFQTEPCGVVLSGAEAACRIDLQNGSAGGFCGGFFPAGLDVQLVSHRKRLEILFPVVRPVFLPNAGADSFQSAVLVFGVLGFHLCQHGSQSCQHFGTLCIFRQVDRDAGFTACQFHEPVLQIVPLAVFLFQKLLKILCVLYHAAADPQILQPDAQQVNGGRGGVNINLCPVHAVSPFCSSFCS